MSKRRRLKRIEVHTPEELDTAIDVAVLHCRALGLDFYTILHGIDAYMQRRRNRDEAARDRMFQLESEEMVDPWGNS